MPKFIDINDEDGIERDPDTGLPTAIRIWVPGENPLVDGGSDLFDETSAQLLREQQETSGRRFSFDYNHATFRSDDAKDPAQAAEAAGWHTLEIRDNGECWLRVEEWIDPAGERILSKKYRYLSPVFDADETGRIIRYTNCALTNVPMTLNAVALRARAESKTMDLAKILAALGFTEADIEGKSEEEIMEMIRSCAPAARADGEPHAEPDGDEARGEGGEHDGDEVRSEDPPEKRAEEPAAASQERSAKAPARRVAAGFAPVGGSPIAAKPAARKAQPTTQSGSKNVMRSVGLVPSANVHSRRRAGLPEVAPDVLKLPAHLRFTASKDLVILRNSGDLIHFERSEDEKEMIRRKYSNPRLGR